MPIIIPGNSAVAGGYDVDNSCRFEFPSTSYMTKSSSSVANQTKFTISVWVKRSNNLTYSYSGFNNDMQIIGQTTSSYCRLMFNSTGTLQFYGETRLDLKTNRKFKDFSAWYHIFIAVDTTQGTAANRVKMFINGVQETSLATATYPNQNDNISFFKNSQNLVIGRSESSGGYDYLNAYLSEFVCLEGTAAAATDFGEFDGDSGIWKPIESDQSANKGANGFFLDFKDSSNLGNDAYGGTDFTESNITATDQATDTCTNNGATLMITGKDSVGSYIWVDILSEGSLLGTSSGSAPYANYVSTVALTTGKWYWESSVIMSGSTNANSGLGVKIANYAQRSAWNSDSGSYYFSTTGKKGNAQTPATNYGSAVSSGNIVGVAYDATNGTIWFSINGSWQNSATLSEIAAGTTTNAAFSSMPSGAYLPFSTDATSTRNFSYGFNFGSPFYAISTGNTDSNDRGNFEYEVPAGFLSICTKNLSGVLS